MLLLFRQRNWGSERGNSLKATQPISRRARLKPKCLCSSSPGFFPQCKSPQKYQFPFSVSSGLLPLSETPRSVRAHILNENIFLKQSWSISSLCQCDRLYFPKVVLIISFSPTVLQWILATPSSKCSLFSHYFGNGWALWLLWARGCGGSNADGVWLLCSFCLGYLECLLLGNSLLEPSHHSVRSPSHLERLWSTAQWRFQPTASIMWVSHLRQPALLRLEMLQPSQRTISQATPSEDHSAEPTQPLETWKEQ